MIICIALFLLMVPDLKTVSKVDLQKYSGVWYEIARLPNKFQMECAGDASAEYTLREDGKIKVVNRCRAAGKPKPKEAEGVARVSDEDNGSNSILDVRFAPAILSFLDSVWGDYRIIALDEKYRYALVGSSDRKYLWILSRTKTLDDKCLQASARDRCRAGLHRQPDNPYAAHLSALEVPKLKSHACVSRRKSEGGGCKSVNVCQLVSTVSLN